MTANNQDGVQDDEGRLRRALAEFGSEPPDLADLVTTVRPQVARSGFRQWLPAAAAIAVLALVAGVITVSHLGNSRLANSPRPPGPSSVSGPEITPSVMATYTATVATKPFVVAPSSYKTLGFGAAVQPGPCSPSTLSMKLTSARTKSDAGDYYGAQRSTEFTVLARATTTHNCTIDMHGLPAEARNTAGKLVSQGSAMTADGRPSILVEPGDLVTMRGTWEFSCSAPDGPLTLSVDDPVTESPSTGWVLGEIPAPGPVANCDQWTGGGPLLQAVAVSRPGSIQTLDARLDLPAKVAPGAHFQATIELINHTDITVAMKTCPDFVLAQQQTVDDAAAEDSTWRFDCPVGLALAPGQSLDIAAQLTAPKSASVIVNWGWAVAGSAAPGSIAAVGSYVVTGPPAVISTTPVPRASSSIVSSPSTPAEPVEALHLVAVPASAPYLAEGYPRTVYRTAPYCTAGTVSARLAPAQPQDQQPAVGQRVSILVTARAACLISPMYLGAELKDAAGNPLAESQPADESLVYISPVLLEPGQPALVVGDLSINCSGGTYDAVTTLVAGTAVTPARIPVESQLIFNRCDPTNKAVVRVLGVLAEPAGAFGFLQGVLQVPGSTSVGVGFRATLVLTNQSDAPATLVACPDLDIVISGASSSDWVARLPCAGPSSKGVLEPGQSVLVQVDLPAFATAGDYTIGARWYQGAHVAPDVTLTVRP